MAMERLAAALAERGPATTRNTTWRPMAAS